jgi:energy-coupling factor transport system substrate-specific component
MLGWALVGASAGLLRRPLRDRYTLAAFGIVWGFAFDWLLDVWVWSALGSSATAASFLAIVSTGLPFDVAHASGNALLALAAGPTLIRMLDRYARRLTPSFAPLEDT